MAIAYTPPPPTRSRSVETVQIDSIVVCTGPRYFGVRVPDASLRSVALLTGDVVICKHGVTPQTGNVVAALVDGASVLPVWMIRGGRSLLRCPDGESPPVSAQDLVIQGISVQGVRSRGR